MFGTELSDKRLKLCVSSIALLQIFTGAVSTPKPFDKTRRGKCAASAELPFQKKYSKWNCGSARFVFLQIVFISESKI